MISTASISAGSPIWQIRSVGVSRAPMFFASNGVPSQVGRRPWADGHLVAAATAAE